MTDEAQVKLSLNECHQLAREVLTANGCDGPNATAVANNMTRAEADGCASHGLFRLPGHVASLRSGKVNGTAQPAPAAVTGSVIRLDGDGGFAPHAHQVGRDPLIAAAREQGLAAMAITRTHHFAALWPEAEMLAAAGLVSMVFVSSVPFMAPAGGSTPLFGTNPVAFGWPRPSGAPMVWDLATSVMARGEIQIALRDGVPVHEGAGIGPDGAPTTDPAAILEGAQLPFGGYKGSAIALMVELMAGPLFGEVTSAEAGAADNGDGGPSTGGELILAFDPARLGARDAAAHGETVFEAIVGQPGARLPGDRRLRNRARTAAEGIAIPRSLYDTVWSLR